MMEPSSIWYRCEQKGTLIVWLDEDPSADPWIFDVQLGHLDLVEELTGVRARLENLGYHCGTDNQSDGVAEALVAFQKQNGLTPDGKPGPETWAKLQELHGC